MSNDNDSAGAPRRQKVQAAEVGTDILKGLAELAPATSLSKWTGVFNTSASAPSNSIRN